MPMTVFEFVKQHYKLPFKLYPFQEAAVNALAGNDGSGFYLDVGAGKTATATAAALFQKLTRGHITIVAMPPILIRMWGRWLDRLDPSPTWVAYAGSPKKRAEIKFDKDFILMSMPVFKKDFDQIMEKVGDRPMTLIVDEAHCIKNVSTDNHKAVRYVSTEKGGTVMLLTGTPLSTPADAYAYCRLIAPGVYRSLRQFENIHVEERDFFGNVTKWKNLDLLSENMKINAVRILREDVLKELPPITYTPLFYSLDPGHYALYRRLATEELIELETGGKIDATNASALINALSQIVVNYDHFSGDPSKVSTAFELVEEVLDELGDRKLIVVAKYRMTNRQVLSRLSKYGAVAVFGELSTAQQNSNLERFITDPTCRVLVLQPRSGGFGVDGLQHVCHDMLFIEPVDTPPEFTQVVARLQRGGQHNPVHVRMAVAEGTIQVRRFKQLMDKDALINRVIRSAQDLRAAVFGD